MDEQVELSNAVGEVTREVVKLRQAMLDAMPILVAARDAVASMRQAGDGRVLRKQGLALERALQHWDDRHHPSGRVPSST